MAFKCIYKYLIIFYFFPRTDVAQQASKEPATTAAANSEAEHDQKPAGR